MSKIIIIFLTVFPALHSQDLHSPENIKLFAEYLFCTKDYLRSAEEFERYLRYEKDDSAEFKAALAYSRTGDYAAAEKKFSSVTLSSSFYQNARSEYFKSVFQQEEYRRFRRIFAAENNPSSGMKKLYNYSFLIEPDENIPARSGFLLPFYKNEIPVIDSFYTFKQDPPYRNPLLASIISAVIPGGGKIYTGNYGDGITALIAAGIFAFLSYDNFRAGHEFRGWLFAAAGSFFYAGNIYGSYASAEIFNAKTDFEFNTRLNIYLNEQNYFMPEIKFCED